MKIIILLFLTAAAFAQAPPELPEPQAKPVHIYTFRTDWKSPALRTNRQVLKSWQWWAIQAAQWGALAVAVRNPKSGEHADSEIPAVAAGTALEYLADRYMSELDSIGMGAYMTVHYSMAATK